MNITNVGHILYALLMQAVVGMSTGNWWAGAALGAGFFLGREHAQREAKVSRLTKVPVASLKPWQGLLGWSRDAKLDFYPAAIIVCAVAYIITIYY